MVEEKRKVIMNLKPFQSPITPTWCPGCGDFAVLRSLQTALVNSGSDPAQTVICYGIGCSGNMADFNVSYGFHGLHGRALANAIGVKLANHDLKVVVIAGDGDAYGEGLNHLIALARGNHDVTIVIHNNSRYSLTTGQSSPTTTQGIKTKSTPQGVVENPFNPLASCLVAGASFVARGYSSQPPQLTKLIQAGLDHPGFALIDVVQLCPTFNKEQDHAWFAERVYQLDETDHDETQKNIALERALENDQIPLGIFYQDPNSKPYHSHLPQLNKMTLMGQRTNPVGIEKTLDKFI
jgi:2-oxoglutarate/2-oxoacid ferredoxin oxidoreductase subunit beta